MNIYKEEESIATRLRSMCKLFRASLRAVVQRLAALLHDLGEFSCTCVYKVRELLLAFFHSVCAGRLDTFGGVAGYKERGPCWICLGFGHDIFGAKSSLVRDGAHGIGGIFHDAERVLSLLCSIPIRRLALRAYPYFALAGHPSMVTPLAVESVSFNGFHEAKCNL